MRAKPAMLAVGILSLPAAVWAVWNMPGGAEGQLRLTNSILAVTAILSALWAAVRTPSGRRPRPSHEKPSKHEAITGQPRRESLFYDMEKEEALPEPAEDGVPSAKSPPPSDDPPPEPPSGDKAEENVGYCEISNRSVIMMCEAPAFKTVSRKSIYSVCRRGSAYYLVPSPHWLDAALTAETVRKEMLDQAFDLRPEPVSGRWKIKRAEAARLTPAEDGYTLRERGIIYLERMD